MKRGLPTLSPQCHGDTRSRFSLLWLFLSVILLPANCTAQGGTNVLLITIDTLRADHLGCYGYQGIKTPHIDGLARDGVLFTLSPLTLPMRRISRSGSSSVG